MFSAFKAFVEKQSGHQILKLRSNNGGEYVNSKFINIFSDNGIQMQHIVPYTPQQNGVAKRKNRTLKEMDNSYEPSLADVPPPSIPSTSETISSSDHKSALAGDPTEQRRTCSQFNRASSLLAQASTNYDPDTFAEASGHLDWDAAMNEEYHSLLANDTWDLVPLLKGRKLVRCKSAYRTKYGPDGKVDKHKSRLVAKGFSQVEGIDYTETFSPISKMNYVCLILSLVASFKWKVHQMDVKSIFLHGNLHEEIYMEQPPGFMQTDSSLVCRLKKSLYGLK
eukprot:PITA_07669